MNPRAIIVALAVAASLGVAACGGGDKKSGDKLSKTELAAKAAAICKTAQTTANTVKTPDLADPDAAAKYFDTLAKGSQTQSDDLKKLNPADDVKDDWNAFVDAVQDSTDLLKDTAQKAKDKDKSGLTDFQSKAPKIAEKVGTTATKVGATDCG